MDILHIYYCSCQIAHERFLLFLFLLAMEKCEVMCLIDFLIVFCMQDKASRCLVMGILVELLTKECHHHRETHIQSAYWEDFLGNVQQDVAMLVCTGRFLSEYSMIATLKVHTRTLFITSNDYGVCCLICTFIQQTTIYLMARPHMRVLTHAQQVVKISCVARF